MVTLNISAALAGDEDQLLNGIWISLLSVEALMVFGVAVRGLIGAIVPRLKQHRLHVQSR